LAPTTAAPATTAAPEPEPEREPARPGKVARPQPGKVAKPSPPKCVDDTLTKVELPKPRSFKKSEKAVAKACANKAGKCIGYFKGGSGWHILVKGKRTFGIGSPNKSIKVVKRFSF